MECAMSEDVQEYLGRAIDEAHSALPVATRRQMITGAAATLGGMGLMGALPSIASASVSSDNSTTNILTVAATAEVLATIVNTVGWKRGLGGDAVTQRNIAAAAREELIHFNVLYSIGARPATRKIWVPDAVFANRTNFLSTLEVGDQIFVNAYLIATKHFAALKQARYAVVAAEFMGVEAVHRALARQSLGKLGNDRVFMKFDQREHAPDAPNKGQRGFEDILVAVKQLEAAGFGFGKAGASPGRFFDFDTVMKTTPSDPDLNTFQADAV
jgi:hypothetical protein